MTKICLARRHDALLLDLDGTLVRASSAIPHAAEAIACARRFGAHPLVVTNNASRSPERIATHLSDLGIRLSAGEIFTSPQAAAEMLAARCPPGSNVLVVGSDWLRSSIAAAGLVPVGSADARPAAVVQGFSPDVGWPQLAEASLALRAGARWVATNADPTLPTERGPVPSNGALVAALTTATGRRPEVAGKPRPALLHMATAAVGSVSPLAVGDRLSTDIAGAAAAGVPSLLVLSGVTSAAALLAASPNERPTYLGTDLRAVVDSQHCVRLSPHRHSGHWHADADGSAVLLRSADSIARRNVGHFLALAALAESCREAWAAGVTAVRAGDRTAESALAMVGLA